MISVKAFTWKNQGNASNVVVQRTDISAPSPPIVVNLTCLSHDMLYVRWQRPFEFYNSIDFYIVSYKSADEPGFQEIRFNASVKFLQTAVSFERTPLRAEIRTTRAQLLIILCIVLARARADAPAQFDDQHDIRGEGACRLH